MLTSPFDYCGEEECSIDDDNMIENQFVFLNGSPDALIMTKN